MRGWESRSRYMVKSQFASAEAFARSLQHPPDQKNAQSVHAFAYWPAFREGCGVSAAAPRGRLRQVFLALHSQVSAWGTTGFPIALALHSQVSARGVKLGVSTPIAIKAPAASLMSVNISYLSAAPQTRRWRNSLSKLPSIPALRSRSEVMGTKRVAQLQKRPCAFFDLWPGALNPAERGKCNRRDSSRDTFGDNPRPDRIPRPSRLRL